MTVQTSGVAPPWWVQRWLELLDSYRFKKRLERARIYAREGHVLSIDFEGSQVLARVQGSEPEPYRVSLSLNPFSDGDWEHLIETMSEKAIFSAQLLAGRMPDEIEGAFIQNGLSLFPFTLSEIRSHCSCPDKANPCKHVGAVYYQLAERFSEDPFVLFQLRGRTQEQILQAIRQRRGQELGTVPPSTDSPPPQPSPVNLDGNGERLTAEQFWNYDEPLESELVAIVPPLERQTLLERLGSLPLPYEEAQAVQQYWQQVYSIASQQAVATALDREGTSEG